MRTTNLGRKSSLQKAKTPAGLLALLNRIKLLPKEYATATDNFCQGRKRTGKGQAVRLL
jgi:hypothetical protein